MKKYRNSSKGKETRAAWLTTKNGREFIKKYNKEYSKSSIGKAVRKKVWKKYSSTQKGRAMERRRHLKRTYGMSIIEYNRLFEAQHRRCAICFELPKDNKHLCVDHDHKCCPGETSCGKCIRGLLCHKCNTILGLGSDSPLLFQEVLHYLERRYQQ